jgi:hypothetical protein
VTVKLASRRRRLVERRALRVNFRLRWLDCTQRRLGRHFAKLSGVQIGYSCFESHCDDGTRGVCLVLLVALAVTMANHIVESL